MAIGNDSIWEFGEIPPGQAIHMDVRWPIGLNPGYIGIELENCVEVGAAEGDGWPEDNQD